MKALRIIAIDLGILTITLLAVPQETPEATVGASLLVLFWATSIFAVGLNSCEASVRTRLQGANPLLVALSTTVLPYLLILGTSGTSLPSAPIFVAWYLLPAGVLALAHRFQDRRIRLIGLITGAALLWIGFDHRYTKVLFEGYKDMSYILNSFWVASIVFTNYGLYRGMHSPLNTADQGLTPTMEGAKVANLTTLAASVIVIPFGLLTGFLKWNPSVQDAFGVVVGFIGIYLTIALQEEVIFRGIMLRELDEFMGDSTRYWPLIMVSVAFALTHWNNETPAYVPHYFFAAFIAGLAYGVAYRRGGLFAAMLSHTLVDWVWALLLKRA